MASPRPNTISTSEKKDLDKFTKYLSMKAVQAVVQARLGEKSNAPSLPDTSEGTSWYNLAIRDIPEVLSETKKAMSGQLPAPGRPLVIEISLKTVEGDSLVLEWWRMSVVAGGDQQIKVTHTVYNRMGLLLKSLITVARVTPAYKLSRTQGQDSYVICYRVFLGDPLDPPDLGEGALTARVGQVNTPINTIVCSVDYRTSMTISPRQSQPINVKSDHFEAKPRDSFEPREDVTPRMYRREYLTSESSEQGITSDDSQEMRVFATSPPDRPRRMEDDSSERLRFGAFARTDSLPCLEEELQEPLLNLLPRPRPGSAVSVTSGETSTDSHTDTQFLMSSDSGKLAERGLDRGRGRAHSLGSKPQISQSQGIKKCMADILSEERQGQERKLGGNSAQAGELERRSSGSLGLERRPSGSLGLERRPSGNSGPDRKQSGNLGLERMPSGNSIFGTSELDREFVMIDLKTPFAQPSTSGDGSGGGSTDPTLGSFFKEVSSAPTLQSLAPAPPIGETFDSLSNQLFAFESNLNQYDDMLEECGSNSQLEN